MAGGVADVGDGLAAGGDATGLGFGSVSFGAGCDTTYCTSVRENSLPESFHRLAWVSGPRMMMT